MGTISSSPFVSVIIPVKDAELTLHATLSALENQSYPRNKFEVIVVLNNTNDSSQAIAEKHNVVILAENSVESSYAARNRGVREARGEVYAFLDADCTADQHWIEHGLIHICESNANLVGGNIRFSLGENPSIANYYDSICFMQQEHAIRSRNVAFTANLFVRKEVFADIGPFPQVQSGGDIAFTQHATEAGHKLSYSDKAIITHPPRTFHELLKKSKRIASGKTGRSKSPLLSRPQIRHLWPWDLSRSLKTKNYRLSVYDWMKLWLLHWIFLVVFVSSWFSRPKQS